MPRFNLSNPVDFSRVTGPSASIIQGLLDGASEWDIQEGSFNGVPFHIFESNEPYQAALSQIQDSGGRRKVKYTFPYVDGQTTDDMGRAPEGFSLNILLHGNNYLAGFRDLFIELNQPTPGTLVHPIRGAVQCVMESFQIIHESQSRKAMAIQLTMIEHNFTIGDIETIQDDISVKGFLSKALDVFKAIDNVKTSIDASFIFARNFKRQILEAIDGYQSVFTLTLGRLNKTFNFFGSADIPGALPVNDGGILGEDGGFVSDIFTTAVSPSEALSSVPIDDLAPENSITLASIQLQKEVNAAREQVNKIIKTISDGASGRGSLEFQQEIIDLKASAIILQNVLESGVNSSKAFVVNYVTPRVMSLREVAFLNNLTPDRANEIDLLNPDLETTNFIFPGVSIKVPAA